MHSLWSARISMYTWPISENRSRLITDNCEMAYGLAIFHSYLLFSLKQSISVFILSLYPLFYVYCPFQQAAIFYLGGHLVFIQYHILRKSIPIPKIYTLSRVSFLVSLLFLINWWYSYSDSSSVINHWPFTQCYSPP